MRWRARLTHLRDAARKRGQSLEKDMNKKATRKVSSKGACLPERNATNNSTAIFENMPLRIQA